jgi:hypothetical protein
MRRVLAICLTFALLWQAAAGPAWSSTQVRDLSHAALHWLEEGHHHHEDGSYHEDDSSESVQHLVADGGLHASGLLPPGWVALPSMGSPPPGVTIESIGPPPFIGGPRRPPRCAV